MARTPAAVSRLWDVIPLVSTDPRIQLTFTIDHGSVFSGAVDSRLIEAGARVSPWADAVDEPFDLALAASDNGDLSRIRAPLVLLSHGAGYHRYAAAEQRAISGLRRSTLIHNGRAVPHTLALAHPDQIKTVEQVSTALAARALVVGDPCLDRITASATRYRQYRNAFDAENTKLVVICSTWGQQSLFGRFPDLPQRIVHALSSDHYRVALVLHPNVWQRHGSLQIRAWLSAATDSGLVVIDPEEGWRAALVAADVVISDHGSLTCYATATGKPVLTAADGGAELVQQSPLSRLLDRLPRLDLDLPLADQIENAIANGAVATDITETMFAEPGMAAAILRTRIYEILRLPQPPWPATVRPIPVPTPTVPYPDAFHVTLRAAEHVDDGVILTLERHPAGRETPPDTDHLAASEVATDLGLLERAAVIWSCAPHPSTSAALDWLHDTLRRYPGARIAITGTSNRTVLAELRNGPTMTASGDLSWSAAGSALYQWYLIPEGERPQRIHVEAGTASGSLTLDTTGTPNQR